MLKDTNFKIAITNTGFTIKNTWTTSSSTGHLFKLTEYKAWK